MKKSLLKRFALVVIIALIAITFTTPPSFFAKILGEENAIVQKLQKYKITLGLDLAGGTELDYRIDLSQAKAQNSDDDPMNDVDENSIAESVRDALEARVEGRRGVAEEQERAVAEGDARLRRRREPDAARALDDLLELEAENQKARDEAAIQGFERGNEDHLVMLAISNPLVWGDMWR